MFFTFRLVDSLPRAFLERWEAWRVRLSLRSGVDPAAVDWPNRLRDATPERFARYRRRRSLGVLAALDRGHGACVLREPHAADAVVEAFRFQDGVKMDLALLLVMPNHVHGIAASKPGFALPETLGHAKRFAAGAINRQLGRRGPLWQRETFDRLIRNQPAYDRTVRYIRDNPRGLPAGSFRLWEPSAWHAVPGCLGGGARAAAPYPPPDER